MDSSDSAVGLTPRRRQRPVAVAGLEPLVLHDVTQFGVGHPELAREAGRCRLAFDCEDLRCEAPKRLDVRRGGLFRRQRRLPIVVVGRLLAYVRR